jgi:hypothetical protein
LVFLQGFQVKVDFAWGILQFSMTNLWKMYENLYGIIVFNRKSKLCIGFHCFFIDFLLIFEGCLKRTQLFPWTFPWLES